MRIGMAGRAAVLLAVAAAALGGWSAAAGAGECGSTEDCVDGGVVGVVEVEAPEEPWDEWFDPGWGGGWYEPLPQPAHPVDPGQPGPGLVEPAPDDEILRKEGRGIRDTREALARDDCRAYLSGPAGDAATLFQQINDGGRLRMDPADNGERTLPDGSVRQLGAQTTGTGADARIEVYGSYYFDDVMRRQLTMWGVDQPLTAEQGRALVLLHEIGHATGAYGDHSDAEIRKINVEIVRRCLST